MSSKQSHSIFVLLANFESDNIASSPHNVAELYPLGELQTVMWFIADNYVLKVRIQSS